MYCKKCGKVIPDDSLFCQYCGEQLSDTQPTNKQERKGLISRFQSLSKGWQIALMSYVCWVFLWIILCVTEAIDDYDQAICLILFVIVLPVLALFAWYYFARLRRKNKEEDESEKVKRHASQQKTEVPDYSKYSIYPLLDFAKEHGKMQVKVEKDGDSISSSYCVFTNTNGEITQVDFSSSTKGLTAVEISSKKERLFVVKAPSQIYSLVEI